MKIHETVRPATDGQRRDIEATMRQAIPDNLSFDAGKRITGDKGQFLQDIRSVFLRYEISDQMLAPWQEFWQISLAGLMIPRKREVFDRLLVIAAGATIEGEYQKCEKLFPCWRSTKDNLDVAVATNDRDAKKGSYALWVRDRVEADDELRALSANDLSARKLTTMTLLERIVYERKYFLETGGHLDIQNVTLCAGSRSRDGSVPHVDFYDGRFRVGRGWCYPGVSYDSLRAREAVV
jgi:hypothetical protein